MGKQGQQCAGSSLTIHRAADSIIRAGKSALPIFRYPVPFQPLLSEGETCSRSTPTPCYPLAAWYVQSDPVWSSSSRLLLPFSFSPAGWDNGCPMMKNCGFTKAASSPPVRRDCAIRCLFSWWPSSFLIFDVEGAYIFSWAVASRPLGWAGWFQIQFFIGVLIAGLVYIWVKGGLEWGPHRD
jgi:hypothetical protein